ncbi:MAG: ABC transporter permease [Bacteroidota bacterium]
MSNTPPKFATRLLLKFLRDDLAEEVVGDLEEKFRENPSRLTYYYQVFNYLRPFAMRKKRLHPATHIDMFKNYFKIGFRQMAKNKMYSTINIGGFAVGIAACLLLAIYIYGELNYDKFYVNQDRIYRVVEHHEYDGQHYSGVHMAHPFGDALKELYPDLEQVGYYNDNPNFGAATNEVRRTDRLNNTHEDKIAFVNQGLLDVLDVQFVKGNPHKALNDRNTIVITESIAKKYFGDDEDPIGKSLILNDNKSKVYAITGVVKDFPSNSHIQFDFMISSEDDILFGGERTSWCCNNWMNYVRVKPGTDIAALEKKFERITETYMLPQALKRNAGKLELDWVKSFRYALQPVDEVYLNVDEIHDGVAHGDIRFIWLFGSIATLILFLACINFINLSTARSANRAKEVGIRKTIGSLRASIVRQFLAESFMFSIIALVIGIVLAQLMIPIFNNLVGKSLSFPWTQWWIIPCLLASALLIGFIAGVYPAFYLSAFRPVKVLKGGVSTGARNTRVRSALVIFQFTISIMLIVGTIIIERQMQYALNKDLGFDRNNVMILHGTITLGNQVNTFKEELKNLADVRSVSGSNYLPINDGKRDGGSTKVEGAPGLEVNSQQWEVDTEYIRTMGFRIFAGRDFDPKIASDSSAMIINQTMAKQFTIDDLIGRKVTNYAGTFTIIGIVEDFHFDALTQQIAPVSMFVTKRIPNIVSVKLSSNDIPAAIESVSRTWQKLSPNQPISYEFLDDRYEHTYNDVKRFGLIVKIFTSLAIIVACLGLFALSAFMIEQRGKEISIRMVLGAPVANILRLLSQNFVMLVAISFVIAVPFAWYLMDTWLQDYAYKIDITWDVFVITGMSALAIALLTISYQSVKASLMNPVVNLKSE